MIRLLVRLLMWIPRAAPEVWRNWSEFWFAPADPTLVGVLRAMAGSVLVLVLVQSTVLIPTLYAADGMYDLDTANTLRLEAPTMLPDHRWEADPGVQREPYMHRRELYDAPSNMAYFKKWGIGRPYLYHQGSPLFSHLFHVRDLTTIYALHGVAILIALAFALGLGSRVTAVAAWLIALSYSHRANAAIFGMDTMLAITLLYLMLAPTTAAFSLDRLIASRRANGLLPPPEPSRSANLALRCIQVHFCVIYLVSGLSKLQGPAWWNGDAIWQTLSNLEFAPAKFPWSEGFLSWLAKNRLAWEVVNFGGCVYTLVLETTLPFWIWYRRPRPWLICASALLHTGIGLLMGLSTFGMLMLVMLGAFLPAEVLHAAIAWARSRRKIVEEKVELPEPEREMAAVG